VKSPAFQFYAGDWLSSQRVALMTLEEEGAYIRLLAYCWQHGSIPSDPEKIARLIGKGASTTLATTLATMFEPGGDGLIHRRLEEEREKQKVWSEKSSAGGKKSAEARRIKKQAQETPTTDEPPLEGCLPDGTNQNPTLHSSSPSSTIPLLFPLEGDKDHHERILPKDWKNLTKEQRKRIRVNVNSPAMDTIGRFFSSQKTVRLWTVAEAVALREVKPTREEVEILARYYNEHFPKEEDYRRRDLATLLNNWQTEVDRARSYFANNSAA
jgi:uncharacterized protein YdaU (DUF1376 family)